MGSHKVRSDPPGPDRTRGLNTRELLRRARAGEENALNSLFARFLPHLQRWAHRRVPGWARNGADSSDFVQDTVLQTIRNLSSFEPQRDGALLGYLRRSLINRIRNQFRQAGRHPHAALGDMDVIDSAASPLEFTIDHQNRVQVRRGAGEAQDRQIARRSSAGSSLATPTSSWHSSSTSQRRALPDSPFAAPS